MYKIAKSFTTIAPYYDILMRRVRYREWMHYIERIIRINKKDVKTILDIACGTGNGTLNLQGKYENYLAFDLSLEMVKVFKNKLSFYDIDPLVFVANVLDIPLKNSSVDAAFSIFDSLNNLTDPKELKRAFSEVHRVLRPDGVFTFDLNTHYVLKEEWDNKIRIEEDENVLSVWRTHYSHKISELHITIFAEMENGVYKRIDEIHRERGYNEKEIIPLLREIGFRKVEAYDHLSFSPPKENSLRINYVAIK